MSKSQMARRVRDSEVHDRRRANARSRVLKPSVQRRQKAAQA